MSTGTLPASDVRTMFDRIAPVYDVMNRVMTAGLDLRWRRLTAEAVVRPGNRVLDACCGTGDLAVADLRAGATEVTGLDFSPRMLERARRKSSEITWVEGDMLELPFADGSFEAATVGFGVRNVADLERALAELRRVLVPGGRVAILEITTPRGTFALFYRLWFDRIVRLAPLERLSACEAEGGVREQRDGVAVAGRRELGEGAREEIVAGGPGGSGAVGGPGGGPAAAELGAVDQVVVDEGRHVNELDGRAGGDGRLPARRCREEDEQRP